MSQSRFEIWHLDLQDLLGLTALPVAIAGRLEKYLLRWS